MNLPNPGALRTAAMLTRRFQDLMRDAEAGGRIGADAARRAAALALNSDPAKAELALERVAELDPMDGVSRLALAQLQADRGDWAAARAQAEAAFAQAFDQAARGLAAFALGELALTHGDRAAAKDAFLAARGIQEGILRAEPADLPALRHHARACQRLADFTVQEDGVALGRLAHAEALSVLEVLAEREEAPLDLAEDLAHGCARIAALSMELGDDDAAQKCADACIGWRMRLVDGEPDLAIWRVDLAAAWEARAALDLGAKRFLQARGACDQALRLRLGLAATAPSSEDFRRALASCWRLSAQCAARVEEWKPARQAAAQARLLSERGAASPEGARAYFSSFVLEGDIAFMSGEFEDARAAFASACTFAQPLAQQDSDWLALLAHAWERLGDTAMRARLNEAAGDAFARARALGGQADQRREARLQLKLGEAALAREDRAGARAAFARSCATRLELVEAEPGNLALARELAVGIERIGLLAQAAGETELARAAWRDELKIAEALRQAAPRDGGVLRFCAIVRGHLVTLEDGEHLAHRAEALRLIEQLEALGPLNEADRALRTRLQAR